MEPLLAFADDLERRDADSARALAAVERLQREIDELRAHGRAAAAFLTALPGASAQREADVRAAVALHADAERALREADAAAQRARPGDERLEIERELQSAQAALEAATRSVSEARDERERLERESRGQRRASERVSELAAALSGSVHGVPAPGSGLDAALDWAARARGALLLERAQLVSERELIVREANELLGGALGEPLAVTAVAGLRARLERALAQA